MIFYVYLKRMKQTDRQPEIQTVISKIMKETAFKASLSLFDLPYVLDSVIKCIMPCNYRRYGYYIVRNIQRTLQTKDNILYVLYLTR